MSGYTLLEMTAVLMLLAVAFAVAIPNVAGHRDRLQVLAAREALVAAIRDTRAEAVRSGGASLHLMVDGGRGRILVGDSVAGAFTLHPDGRVALLLGGGRGETEIDFGGLGLGLFANETLELVAGTARARLVVSSYGRVRRE